MAEVFPTLMETINTYFRILMSPKCKDHKENYTKAHHIQTVQNLWWREDLFSFLAVPQHIESQARDQIPAADATPNPLCQAGDATCILALQRCHPSHCAPQWELLKTTILQATKEIKRNKNKDDGIFVLKQCEQEDGQQHL